MSRELRSARQLVANTLTFLGYQPVWQDIFGTEGGDLRGLLRQQVDQCKGVVQLVGNCYGTEPPTPDEEFGRISYTQYEALYARQRGRKVWYLFIDESFPADPHESEPPELAELQQIYRRGIKTDAHVFHPLATREALEASVLKLRDDLTRLRRGVKQWAAGVGVLLVVIAGSVFWLLRTQHQTTQEVVDTKLALAEMTEEMKKLRQSVMQYPQVDARVREAKTEQQNLASIEDRVYAELAKEQKIDPKELREKLPQVAARIRQAPNATSSERAHAAYVEKDYAEAERFALMAAADARNSVPPKTSSELKALELAGWAAEARVAYDEALKDFREAEKLTSRVRDGLEWAEVQFYIARILSEKGQFREAELILREVQEEHAKILGPEHPKTLKTRANIANALSDQGRLTEAEVENRAILQMSEKNLGPGHPDTLRIRCNFAASLKESGKYKEAESELRIVLAALTKTLGPDHPDTLSARQNLADTLDLEGKTSEAETENRAVLEANERIRGPEHPDTLASRNNLAVVLLNQKKYVEAESENRLTLRLRRKVLGPEHPDTLTTWINLGNVLLEQKRYTEAEVEIRAALQIAQKVLGHDHPYAIISRFNLANTLDEQQKFAETETEYRELLTLFEKVFGTEHPNTLNCCYSYANCLMHLGKVREARPFAQRAAEMAVKVLGNGHPDTQKYLKLLQDLDSAAHR